MMNGGYRFYEDLRVELDKLVRVAKGPQPRIIPHFARVSSYKNTESTGELKGTHHLDNIEIAGKNILVVEDMIDTGLTLKTIMEKIDSYKPAKFQIAVAFHKKTQKNVEWGYFADYTGFLVPQLFVIGYGMDYNGIFRDLPHLCKINQAGIEKFKEVEDPKDASPSKRSKLE